MDSNVLGFRLTAVEAIVLKWSACCRFVSFLLQVILNAAVTDYDSSACCLQTLSEKSGWSETLLGGLKRWDSVYFLGIADRSYEYEQYAAFFPLWPASVQLFRDVALFPLSSVLADDSRLLLSAHVTGTFFFCSSAVLLYRLTVRVTHDQRLALSSSLLYCLNPATVFFHAAYSTSMFACVSFAAMLTWHAGRKWISTFLTMAACGIRSNGVLCAGFAAYEFLTFCLQSYVHRHRGDWIYRRLIKEGVILLLRMMLIAGALLACQQRVASIYCRQQVFTWTYLSNSTATSDREAVRQIKTVRPPWCDSTSQMSYGYIQSEYWNVGFLRYFELKQAPNFALAFPVLFLTAAFGLQYSKRIWPSVRQLQLLRRESGLWSPEVLVFAVHWVAFVALCVLNVHIQVLTRLVASACPVFFWFAAELFLGNSPGNNALWPAMTSSPSSPGTSRSLPDYGRKKLHSQDDLKTYHSWMSHGVLLYFLVYGYLGLALHTNFYPWT